MDLLYDFCNQVEFDELHEIRLLIWTAIYHFMTDENFFASSIQQSGQIFTNMLPWSIRL